MLKGLVVALLSTGGFDSHTTSGTTDLAAIARGAGLRRVAAVDSVMDFGEAVIEAFSSDELSVIVAKVAAIGPNHYGMDLHLPETPSGSSGSSPSAGRRRELPVDLHVRDS